MNNKISIVIPVFNEQHTLEKLHQGIVEAVGEMSADYEILFVDDGSRDRSQEVIRQICSEDSSVRLISFVTNYGKATALDYGFKRTSGDIVITMDADLQDDPKEISRFVAKINEGYDLVSGWKKIRFDPWHKTLPSRFFNIVVSKLTGIKLNDFNCGYKAYRGDLIRRVSIYGELHRFIPVLAKPYGARIAEIVVQHHARKFGVSKYGIGRLPKGFFDLITAVLTTRYLKRPMHLFGSLGLFGLIFGAFALFYLAVLWVLGDRPIGTRPLLFYGIAAIVMGVQLLSFGMLAELTIRFNQSKELPLISETIGFNSNENCESSAADHRTNSF